MPTTDDLHETIEKLREVVATLQDRVENLERESLTKYIMRGGVLVVDAGGAGGFRSLNSALGVAKAGDLILVRPGTYSETVTITIEGLTIRGVGRREVTILHTDAAHCLVMRANAVLESVSVRSMIPHAPAVRFESTGMLTDCDVNSVNISCVIVAVGSPGIKNCEIFGSKQHGVHCKPSTTPLITDCDVHSNKQPNIVVDKDAEPVIRSCKIRDSGQNGVWFREGAKGTLTGCEIYNNCYSNIDISNDARPTMTHNTIYSSGKCGVCFADNSSGDLSHNTIHSNAYSNVGVMASSTPTITHNTIQSSKQHGILIKAGAAGIVADNTLQANALEAIKLEHGSTTVVKGNSR